MRRALLSSEAHPRSRGENGTWHSPRSRPRGSSPLTRGKRRGWNRPAACAGLIPAHAGKTSDQQAPGRRVGAHPRSRGENDARRPRHLDRRGSSPLTRGKHGLGLGLVGGHGLIPAHAGKTADLERNPELEGAHPRSRGENLYVDVVPSMKGGSSPLTRGKLHAELLTQVDNGLIPAHAGKTAPRSPRSRPAPAHPRSRGEN